MVDIRIDTSQLTYKKFLILGVTSEPVDGSTPALVSLQPGTYSFQQFSGALVDFTFEVTPGGTVDYDVSNDAFLSGRGSATLIVRGFSVTLDTRALSHDLHPLGWAGGDLSPGTHAITLMPGKDCAFVSASGIVADFTLTVEADGTVVVDPPAGFAEVSGQTVTIKGYRITLDTRTLSHDLRPLLLGWAGGDLSPGTHAITLVPGKGYACISASGIRRLHPYGRG